MIAVVGLLLLGGAAYILWQRGYFSNALGNGSGSAPPGQIAPPAGPSVQQPAAPKAYGENELISDGASVAAWGACQYYSSGKGGEVCNQASRVAGASANTLKYGSPAYLSYRGGKWAVNKIRSLF